MRNTSKGGLLRNIVMGLRLSSERNNLVSHHEYMGTCRSIPMTCLSPLQRSRILSNELLLLRWKGIGKYHRLGVSLKKLCDFVLVGTTLSIVVFSAYHARELCLSFWFRFSSRFLSLCCLPLFRSLLILTFCRNIFLFPSELLR